MWRAAMDLAGGATVGLDGVVSRQADYARSGFRLVRRHVRYEGRGGGAMPAGVTDVADAGRSALLEYDRSVFRARREAFLAHWLAPVGGRALAVVDARVRGYGAIRPCRVGWKVGPLFANDAGVAGRIFAGLAAVAGEAPVYLDVPEGNAAAVELAEAAGMTPVFETARMYRGPAPHEPVERTFGVTTFELG